MNPENTGNGPDSSSNISVKRKRGRPRKDQSQMSGGAANVVAIRDQIQHSGEHSQFPPGFDRKYGTHRQERNAIDYNDDAMVGQMVTGVIEASFDAGYLLSVRIGNTESSLRGVIFKPGQFMPISTENDVAPHVEMIRRSAVPTPAAYHSPVHGSYRRGRGRGRGRSESRLSYSANGPTGNQLAASSDQQLQAVLPAQPSPLAGDRATFVPIVLQPCTKPLNIVAPLPVRETPPAAFQPTLFPDSKAKEINQTDITQMENCAETNNRINSPSAKQAREIDDSVVKSSGGVTEDMDCEAEKRIEVSLPPKETENENPKPPATYTTIEHMQDLSLPLRVEPLQAMWSDSLNQPPPAPQNFRDARAGKMTELLMAVQENVIDKQAAAAANFNQQNI